MFTVTCNKGERDQVQIMLRKLKTLKSVSYMQIIIDALSVLLESESRLAKAKDSIDF